MSYQFLLMQCDYHFVSKIDRHDVISGFVVAVVAKSIQGCIRGRRAPETAIFERDFGKRHRSSCIEKINTTFACMHAKQR